MRLCIDLTEIMGLDCTNPLVRVTAEQWLECYEKWPEHCVGSYELAREAVERYEPPPPNAPAPYAIDLSGVLDLAADSCEVIVSTDQWKRIYATHPDYCYGGKSDSVRERDERVNRRKERQASRVSKPREVSEKPEPIAEKSGRLLSSYHIEDQQNYWSKVRSTLGPAMLKFFHGANAIPTEKAYHPLSYARSWFSLGEIDAYFDRESIPIPKIQIQSVNLSDLIDDLSGDYLSLKVLQDYIEFNQTLKDNTSPWFIEGDNLAVIGNRFDQHARETLTSKLQAIWNYEGEESLIRSGLTLDGLVVDLLTNKPDLIPLWEKCFTEVNADSPYSFPPDELLKKKSAFTRNYETQKWEPAP
jgi:hypothetical protein